MSARLVLALAVFAFDLWALERLWRPGSPHEGRLRWSAAVVLLPVLGAVLAFRRTGAAIRAPVQPEEPAAQ